MTNRFDDLTDAISDRVLERLDARLAEPEPLMDAAAAARFLGVRREAVYLMARVGTIPCLKLGADSERPRLRFDRQALVEHLAAEAPEPARSNGRRRRRRPRPDAPLLPVSDAKAGQTT